MGSTLALAYALEHPDRVLGIALMAVTTTNRDEVDWITEGVGRIFPEAWDEFAAASGALPGSAWWKLTRAGYPAPIGRTLA
ncbi:alpha/beta fold hydrolase [Arthrobacter alpinus]|nr:alpha/beta fold hydrolase [Arthrobacter alpinus]